jgi:hypothetical protein
VQDSLIHSDAWWHADRDAWHGKRSLRVPGHHPGQRHRRFCRRGDGHRAPASEHRRRQHLQHAGGGPQVRRLFRTLACYCRDIRSRVHLPHTRTRAMCCGCAAQSPPRDGGRDGQRRPSGLPPRAAGHARRRVIVLRRQARDRRDWEGARRHRARSGGGGQSRHRCCCCCCWLLLLLPCTPTTLSTHTVALRTRRRGATAGRASTARQAGSSGASGWATGTAQTRHPS